MKVVLKYGFEICTSRFTFFILDIFDISDFFNMSTSGAPASASAPANARRYRTDDMESEYNQTEQISFLPNPFKIVRYGMVTQEDAEKVWEDTLDEWGASESNVTEREILYNYVTAALIQSSSKDLENLETHWTIGRHTMRLRTIHDKMEIYALSNNDSRLRTFVRTFRNGFFVIRQYQALSDPANKEYRSILALRTGEDATNARFMFDTADYLVQSGANLNTDELRLINHYRGLRTARAQQAAAQVGEVAPRNDTTARSGDYGKGRAIAQGGRPVTQTADHRAAMMGLNSLR